MAKENVKKFFDELSKNEDLQKQLKAATEKNEAEIAKAIKAQAETVVEVAKKAGFDFTADEFLASGASTDEKLDMNELDAVAGGKRAGAGCFILGIGWGGASVGAGGNACYVIGIGGGVTWKES